LKNGNNHVGEHFKLTLNFFSKTLWMENPKATLSVKFGFYVRQTTILGGVLDNFPTYLYHPTIIQYFNIYILKPPYINYNTLFQIITYLFIRINFIRIKLSI